MVSESDTLPERGQFSENFGKSTVFSTFNRCKTPLIGLQTSFFVNQHVLQQSKVLCSLFWHPKNSVLGVLKWRRQEFCDFMITLGTRILKLLKLKEKSGEHKLDDIWWIGESP